MARQREGDAAREGCAVGSQGDGSGGDDNSDLAVAATHVFYNPEHGVLICVHCAMSITPGLGVRRHLRNYHKDQPLRVRRAVEAYATRQQHTVDPDAVELPVVRGPPVAGLAVHEGWRCVECGWLSPSEATMREHCRQTHRWIKGRGRAWQAAQMQTFFGGPRRRFFEVERQGGVGGRGVSRQGESDVTVAAQALIEAGKQRDDEEVREAARADDEQRPADDSPWLRKTRWARKFAGRDLRAVAARAERPGRDESALALVWASAHRVLERCRASVAAWHAEEEDGDVVLGWLNSPRADWCNPEPFSTYYRPATHAIYTAYWARCLCYLLRLVHAEDRHGHALAAADEQALQAIWEEAELGSGDSAALNARVFDLSVSLWACEARAEQRSALIHFTAVLGIDACTGSYRPPTTYGPVLAALRYCGRLLLFERALPAAHRRAVSDPCEQFLRVHRRWLVDGRPTPFHYIDNLLAYALGAGKAVGRKARVQWSADRKTLIYRGERVALAELRRFVGEVCVTAEEVLLVQLRFAPGEAPAYDRIDLGALTDDMNKTEVGYSFVSERRNGLGGRREEMVQRLAGASDASRFLAGGHFTADSEGWRRYRAQLERFQALLFLLVHMCGGAPARGAEILPIRHANAAQAPRNVYVCDGQVLVVTSYHKSQAITGQHRVIARFLPDRIGQLVAIYLADVLPFVALFESERTPRGAQSFVWADARGPWTTPQATRALVAETTTRLGTRITIQDYRHIAKAIDREHVRRERVAADEDDDGEAEGEGDDVYDLASGHTTATADAVYGIDAAMLRSLTGHTLSAFRAVSSKWHQFWALPARRTEDDVDTRKRAAGASLAPNKRRRVGEDDGERLQAGLERLLGPGAGFRSAEQEAAVREVVKGTSPLVVVLPPGGGKSLVFQLPASLPGAETTIVVLPFRALLADLVRRCRGLGIASRTWGGDESRAARLLFVSAEAAACNDAFYTFAAGLQAQGRLGRIVVDECHLPLTAASYRHQLVRLDRLRTISCPLVLLTGTLPPALQARLEDAFLLGPSEQGLRYVRASTDRPEVEYRVEACDGIEAAEGRVETLARDARATPGPRRRAVVFCRSRADCERLASRLGCRPYHRASERKEEALALWADGEERVIVATSALGSGVDIAGIDLVVHLGRPHGVVDFVQEVGRAGRARDAPVRSVVVLTASELRWLQSPSSEEGEYNRDALRSYLTEPTCRRQRLTAVMDARGVACEESAESRRCDLCQRRQDTTESEDSEEIRRASAEAEEETGRAEEQARRYASGPQLWRERVRERSLERRRIEEAVRDVGAACAACWLRGVAAPDHSTAECAWLEETLGEKYYIARRRIQFEKGCYSCYRCELPGDWCAEYSTGQRCRRADVIAGIVFAAWGTRAGREWLAREARCERVEALAVWMGRATRIGGCRASNAARAAEWAIRQQGE